MMRRRSAGAAIVLFLPTLLVVQGATPGTATSGAATSATGSVSTARAAVPAVCLKPARRGFVPLRAKGAGRVVTVLALGRGRGGVPLAPPLTTSGKNSFAWDRYGPKPGSARGNVRFNAHTYPDGSALGNWLQRRLKVGNRIILYGRSTALCYRVTRKVVTTPRRIGRYYRTTGSPKLAIIVCSGRRLGPGNWTHRTIWYARPSAS